ncbi:hypothetical protein [Sulfuricystis multivorans]|uniref:hypothetical protein n=1 Tax=Sulfuricystis multivorans TaxID=2211108 RepID=UPI000F81C61A|nr:hypothetical protein [Sulfuricystis multivorans]
MQEESERTNATCCAMQTGRYVGGLNMLPRFLSSVIVLFASAAMHAKCLASPSHVSPIPSETKGWTGKALEFINSGPPALLNNSRRSHRRVVILPYLKHM